MNYKASNCLLAVPIRSFRSANDIRKIQKSTSMKKGITKTGTYEKMQNEREKRKYRCWTKEDMARAISAFKKGDHGLNETSKIYKIPKPTLKRHLEGKNVYANGDSPFVGRPTVLTPDLEQKLTEYILKMQANMSGLTIEDVRRLAFQIAEHNGIQHSFNRSRGIAGKGWYYNFMSRHPNLNLIRPENPATARTKGLNKKIISEYFDDLERICAENSLDATRVYIVSKCKLSTTQKGGQKSASSKEDQGMDGIDDKGIDTTIMCCVNAAGMYVPPMLMFKGMIMEEALLKCAPPGSIVHVSETGNINRDSFIAWLKHFLAMVRPNRAKPILLCIDGHPMYSKNIEALSLARENGIVLQQLPNNSGHSCRPLEMAFFKSLKSFYSQAIEEWTRENPELCIKQYQASRLLASAYGKAASVENAIIGFQHAGLWPVDRYRFKDIDLVPNNSPYAKSTTRENNISY